MRKEYLMIIQQIYSRNVPHSLCRMVYNFSRFFVEARILERGTKQRINLVWVNDGGKFEVLKILEIHWTHQSELMATE